MRTRKAFSLIEIMVTLAIIGIVAAIIMNAYKGVQNSATAVAQQKDQAELNQVLAELRMSGGNLAAIVGTAATPLAVSLTNINNAGMTAAYLTYFLQNPVTANSKTQKGTVGGQTLSANEYIIPFPYQMSQSGDTRKRIVFTSASPSIAQAGLGFIVVNKNSQEFSNFQGSGTPYTNWSGIFSNGVVPTTGLAGAALTPTAQAIITAAQTSNVTGTKYNNNDAYVWDEDSTVVAAPTTTGITGTPTPYQLNFAWAYSARGATDGVTNSPLGTFNLVEYTNGAIPAPAYPGSPAYTAGPTDPTVYIFAYLTVNGAVVTTNDPTAADQSAARNISVGSPAATLVPPNPSITFAGITTGSGNTPLSAYATGGASANPDLVTQFENNSGGLITDANIGTVIGQLVVVDLYNGATGKGFSPFSWNSNTATISANINSQEGISMSNSPYIPVSTAPIPLPPLTAPGVGGTYPAPAGGGTFSFTIPPSDQTYGSGDFDISISDTSSGVSYDYKTPSGIFFLYSP
jgi:prepilin-type N-terminal cleavage/methylation domain-containing protein